MDYQSLMDPSNVPVEILAKRWFFGNISEQLFANQPFFESILETSLTFLLRNGPAQTIISQTESQAPILFSSKDESLLSDSDFPFEDDCLYEEDRQLDVQLSVFEEFAKLLVLDALSDISVKTDDFSGDKGSEKARKQKGNAKRQGGLLALDEAEAQLFLKLFKRI